MLNLPHSQVTLSVTPVSNFKTAASRKGESLIFLESSVATHRLSVDGVGEGMEGQQNGQSQKGARGSRGNIKEINKDKYLLSTRESKFQRTVSKSQSPQNSSQATEQLIFGEGGKAQLI